MEYLELPDGTSYLHLLKNRNTLWEINKEPQVYEVEIVHENDDKNFDDILNMNRVFCSICHLEVPKIYLKQHNKSSLHQNWIRLMEEVLERTKKQLKNNIEVNNSSLNVTETFFCDTCSKIIQNKNSNKHFESKYHKKKVIFEKLLNFFVEAYFNKDDDQFEWEDLNDCMDSKSVSDPFNGLDLKETISEDPSQVPLEVSKDPSDITKVDPVINVLEPDYLEELLESIINKPSVKWFNPQPQNSKSVEKINLPTLQTPTKSPEMDPATTLDPVLKDAKSEKSDNLNSNTTNPNLNPMNPNLNPMNPNLDPMNPYFHTINPNLNTINPNFHKMNPNLNLMNPNLNPMNPNFHHMNLNVNSMNPNLNPMNPNLNPMHPNLNPMHPNLNPMHPNLNPMHPNLNPMHPNLNPMHPNLNNINLNFHHIRPMNANWNTENPSFNPMISNWNPMNLNFNPMNPNFNPMNHNVNPMNYNFNAMNPMDSQYKMNPNFNTVTPNTNPINHNLHPMDPRCKLGPNLNAIEPHPTLRPKLNTIDPQTKLGPHLITMDPQSKLDPNLTTDPQSKLAPKLNPVDPQTKLGPHLITMDLQSKSAPNLITTDPQSKFGPNSITMDLQTTLGPNLITMDPQFELGSNLITTDPQPKSDLNSTDPAPKIDPYSCLANAETKALIKAMKKAERKREKQMKNLQAFEEFSIYIKTIQEKYPRPGFKLEAMSISQIKLTALNGDCVLVTRVNFQSIVSKYCRVCQNGNLGADHEMTEEHISRIMVPVLDKNCIREIDDIWNHCIICNELIKFVEDHNKMATHIANVKISFIDIPKQEAETDPKSIEELNKNILSEDGEGINIQYTENKRNEEEIKRLDAENRNTVDVEKRVTAEGKRVDSQEKKVPYFDIDKFSNTLAYTLLPIFAKYGMTVVDADQNDNFDGSLVTKVKDNKNKLKQSKDSNQKVLDKNDKSVTDEPKKTDDESNTIKYCSLCKLHVTDFETHKTSESHIEINNRARELKKMINRNNLKEIKDSVDLLKCDMCGVNLNYHFKNINEHVYSEHHRRNYFKFIESNKIILIDQVESQCEPCNKSVHRSNIFDHCKQDKHVKKLNDLINITQKNSNPTQKKSKSKQSTENKTVDQKDIDITKILYQFRAQGDEYLCKICHALVAKDPASLKAHVESKQHVEKYNTLLRTNNIFKTTGSFYCKVCEAKIPMTGEITHVYGRNHSDNLGVKARDKVAKDESNGATATGAVINHVAGPSAASIATSNQVSVSSVKTEITLPLYVKYQYKTQSETVSTCIICDQQIPNAEVINHAHSTTHNFNFNLLMINNTIKIKDNMYFCVTCNTSVPVFGEIQHIFGKLHLNNNKKKQHQPIASKGTRMLTYDHVLGLTQGKRMVKF